jgi:hypothetical protein
VSDEHHASAHPEQEPDLQSVRIVLIIFAVLVALTILFSAWAALTVNTQTGRFFSPEPTGPDARLLEETPIQFDLFDAEGVGLQMKSRDRARLQRLGWLDRDRGIVHLPIDLAMQIQVSRIRTEQQRGGDR